MDYYILSEGGIQAGPYSIDQVRAFWASGQITQATPYWADGMPSWQPIRNIEALMAAQTSGFVAPAQSPAKPERKGLGCGSGCLILIVIFGAFVGFLSLLPHDKKASDPAAQSIYNAASEDDAIQNAKNFVIGTWTYTGPNQFWQKWVIREDGTVLAYTANETDSGWGEPKLFNWEIHKTTYSDTGEVCYAFHAVGQTLSDGVLNASIEKDGSLSAVSRYDSSVYATLTRGDNGHFGEN